MNSLKEFKDNLYSGETGSHDKPGNRCRCNPLAGILSEEPWGLYHPDVSESDKEIRKQIVNILYVFSEAGEEVSLDERALPYMVKELAKATSIYNYHKEEEE